MMTFQIRSESFPKRCEVCHQTDAFVPGMNYCARCSQPVLNHSKLVPLKVTQPNKPFLSRRAIFTLTRIVCCLGFILAGAAGWGYLTYQKRANTRNAVSVMDGHYWLQKTYSKQFRGRQYTSRPDYVFPQNSNRFLTGQLFTCRVFDTPSERKEHEQGRYDGYQMKFFLINDGGKSHFCTVMFPIRPDGIFQTGTDCFYIDDTGVLRHSGDPKVLAHAGSPEYPEGW